jgi:hypothetical protein
MRCVFRESIIADRRWPVTIVAAATFNTLGSNYAGNKNGQPRRAVVAAESA